MTRPSIPAPPKTRMGKIGGILDGIAMSTFCAPFAMADGTKLPSAGRLGAGITPRFAGAVNVGSTVALPISRLLVPPLPTGDESIGRGNAPTPAVAVKSPPGVCVNTTKVDLACSAFTSGVGLPKVRSGIRSTLPVTLTRSSKTQPVPLGD